MKNFNIINEIKGIAFLFMLIHHIFYFYDVSKDYNSNLSGNIIVKFSGVISRHIFILLVGINIYLQYSNNNNIYKNIFNIGLLKLLFLVLLYQYLLILFIPTLIGFMFYILFYLFLLYVRYL